MKLAILSIIAAASLAGSALADSFDFSVVSGGDHYTFALDTANAHQNLWGFNFNDVPISDNGVVTDYSIYTTGGDYLSFGIKRLGPTASAFISDSSDSETFVTGDYSSVDPYDGAAYQFSIAPSVSAAPEPGTWALMMLGVAGLGAALRFRRCREVGHIATA